jgi:hypothetical protein
MYQIRGYKTFKGHEGETCGQGNLYFQGKKVAEWSDDSWGGPMRVRFVSQQAEQQFAEHAKGLLAAETDYDGKPYAVADMASGELVELAMCSMSCKHAETEAVRKDCKKGIVVREMVDGKSNIYVFKMTYTAANVAALKARHPGITEVLNETLGLPFMSAQQEADAQSAADEKRYRKMCKTSTVFTLPGTDGLAKVYICKLAFSPRVAEALRAKHPTLIEFLNERYAA